MIGRLFVGNLPWSVTEEEIRDHFSQYDSVYAVKIIIDKATGKSKGYGFVDINNAAEAIAKADGSFLKSRVLTVSEAVRKSKRE